MENKLITIKKLQNGRYFIDLHKYLISLLISIILIFPLIYIPSRNLIFTLLLIFIFWIVVSILADLDRFFGKKTHSKMIEKELFQNLLLKDFNKEKIDEYYGLVTTQKGGTVRVFYNWNKLAEGPLSFGDIDINILYEPPFSEVEQEKIDMKKLSLLTKKYDKKFWSKTKRTLFTYNCLRICINYYPWTKTKTIENEINRGSQLLEENNIKPLDLNNIKNMKLEKLNKQGYFLPNIDLFSD